LPKICRGDSVSEISAPIGSPFTINDATSGDEGAYLCVVSDAVTVVTSPAFTLTLDDNPLLVGGALGLALNAHALAAAGARTARRKR
jgi:hypothetical protein